MARGKTENWSRDQDSETSSKPYVARHDFLPVSIEVRKASSGNRYGITAGNYYVVVNDNTGRRNEEKILRKSKGGAYKTFRQQGKAKNKATSWQEDNPLPGVEVSPETVENAWEEELKQMADRENARIMSHVGDAEKDDGVEKKKAEFGRFTAVNGEIKNSEGGSVDIEMPEITKKGGRVPSKEAEIQTMTVAEQVANRLDINPETVMNIVEKEKGHELGQVTYRATKGYVSYYGDPGLRDVGNVPQTIGDWDLVQWEDDIVEYADTVRKDGHEFQVVVSAKRIQGNYMIDGYVEQTGGMAETDFRPSPDGSPGNAKRAKELLIKNLETMSAEDYLEDVWPRLSEDVDNDTGMVSEGDEIHWNSGGTVEKVVGVNGDTIRLKLKADSQNQDGLHSVGDTYTVDEEDLKLNEDEFTIK